MQSFLNHPDSDEHLVVEADCLFRNAEIRLEKAETDTADLECRTRALWGRMASELAGLALRAGREGRNDRMYRN